MAAIAESVEKERREKIAKNNGQKQKDTTGQKIVPSVSQVENKTAHKAAELFNTNRTYVNNAVKMKAEAPGKSIPQINRPLVHSFRKRSQNCQFNR